MASPRGGRRRRGDADPAREGGERTPETAVDPAERAREIALRLLTHSARSSAQLREGLVSRDVPPEVADAVIERYVEVGLLDDAALAATLVRTRQAERGQARRAIREELRRKGFSEEHAGAALDQIDDEDERERASELAARRWHQLASQPVEVRTRRVVAMLGRKGYSSGLAFALVRDLRDADSQED